MREDNKENQENQDANKSTTIRLTPLDRAKEVKEIQEREVTGPPLSALRPQNEAQTVIPKGTVQGKVSAINDRGKAPTDGTNTKDKTSQSDPTTKIPETTKQNSTQFDSTSFVNAALNQAALNVATNVNNIAKELAESSVESIISNATTQASQQVVDAKKSAINDVATSFVNNVIQEGVKSQSSSVNQSIKAVESVVNPTDETLDPTNIDFDDTTTTEEEKTSLSDFFKGIGGQLNDVFKGIGKKFTDLSNKIRGSENITFSNIADEAGNAVNETKEDVNQNKDITTDQKNKIIGALDTLTKGIPNIRLKQSNRDKVFGKMLEGFKNFLFPTQQQTEQAQQTQTEQQQPQTKVDASVEVSSSSIPNADLKTIVKDPVENTTSLNDKGKNRIMKQARGQMNEIPTQVDPKLFNPKNNIHTNTQTQTQPQQQFQSQQQPRSLEGLNQHNVDNLNLTPFTNNQNPQQQYAPRELDKINKKLDRIEDNLSRTQTQQQSVPQQEKSGMSDGMKIGLGAFLLFLFLINPGLVMGVCAAAAVGAGLFYAGKAIKGKRDEYRDNRKNKENHNQGLEQQQELSPTPNQAQSQNLSPTPPTTPNLNTGQNVGRGGK